MAPRSRARTTIIEPMEDPILDAMVRDEEAVADELSEVLGGLSDIDQGRIKGTLYLVTRGTGRFEWVKDIYPPFDMSAIMADLKAELGGGDFQLRLTVGGRRGVLKNIQFSIMKDRTPAQPAQPANDGMFIAMMRMSQESADRQMTMMQMMQAQQMQMMQTSQAQTTQILTAMMGNREKVTDYLPLFTAMRPDPQPHSNMKETVETLVALKGLLPAGEGGAGFDADDIAGSVMRLAGPVAGALGKAFERRGQAQPQANGHAEGPAPLALSFDAPAGNRVDEAGALPGPALDPVLQLIRPDVCYYFARRNVYAAEEAAGAVYDVLTAAGVSEDQFNALAAAFTLSADWKSDLAAQGIDLRADPAWADAFLAALVAVHTGDDGDRQDHPGGEPGNAGDAGGNGALGAGWLPLDDGARPVGEADDARLPERSGA